MKATNENDLKIESLLSGLVDLPFLFIGSGFSRRYLGLPDWSGLLKVFADQARPRNKLAYDSYVQRAKSEGKGSISLPNVASMIELDFNERWFNAEEFKLQRNKFASSVRRGISPFKLCVADFVSNRSLLTGNQVLLDELACFSRLAKRSLAGVITTNYDSLIENHLEDFKIYIGQDELFFSAIQGIAEIYKIHGSCNEPGSLVINQDDYNDFERKNAYLAAKLLTIFVEHPIIFLGYSITDHNIRSILNSIIDCLPSHKLSLLKNRMIFVEWNGGNASLNDVGSHSIDVGKGKSLLMTKIYTNRFMPIFSSLLKINARYNLSWLRRLKNDIYEVVKSNQPIDRVGLLSMEGSGENEPQYVLGVGTLRGVEYKMPNASEIYRDIVMNNGGFDVARLIEDSLPQLFKAYSRSLPFYKYLVAYEKPIPDFLRNEIANDLDSEKDTFKTNLRRVIRMFDWLKYGKKEKAA